MSGGLALDGIVKSFDGFQLGPVTRTFEAGAVHGLLGPNGAGKTTLLSIIALQTRATQGRFAWAGLPVPWGAGQWKQQVAYVREAPAFYDELSVEATLRFAGRLYDRWDAAAASRLARRLGLPLGKKVQALSKGTRVKLGIVVALAHEANLLLLDEPTAGVDPGAREELYEILREIRSERPHLCVVLSSHILDDLEAAADTVTVLRDGRIACETTRSGLAAIARARALPMQRILGDIYRDSARPAPPGINYPG